MENKAKILQICLGNAYILRKATLLARPSKQMEIDYQHIKSRMFGGGVETVLETSFRDLSRYQIVHNLTQNPFFPRNRNKMTIITTAHELQEIQFPEFTALATPSIKSKLWRQTITLPGIRCLLNSDYATATSKLIKDGLVQAKFPKERIFMTPLGMEHSFINAKKAKRSSLQKGFRIGTLGTAGPQKNSLFSIDAVKQIEGNDLSFEIWGKQIYTEEELLQRSGGDRRIVLKGYVPEAQKAAIYDSFDVFLFPSLFEGFGIPIIEAKVRGLPVVLFKGGRISPEVKEYCFEAKSPAHMAEIVENIKNNGYSSKLRKKAMESARKFTLERTGHSILDAYTVISDSLTAS